MKILLWLTVASVICTQCKASDFGLIATADDTYDDDSGNLPSNDSDLVPVDLTCPSWKDIFEKSMLLIENVSNLARRISQTVGVFSSRSGPDCKDMAIYGCITSRLYKHRNLLMSIINRGEFQSALINNVLTMIKQRMNCGGKGN